MKKQYSIATLLGITQLDAALLLGVHRTQYTMYECGKRDLPLHAAQFLAEMLTFVQENQTTGRRPQAAPLQEKQQIERLSRENEYQRLRTMRKIADTTKKLEAQSRMLLLSEFLSTHKTGKLTSAKLPQLLSAQTAKVFEAPHSVLLLELHHKLELLKLEKLVLDAKIRKMQSDPEFTGTL